MSGKNSLEPKIFIRLLLAACLGVLIPLSIFNFIVDPLAYFRESEINLKKATVNGFYQLGQIVLNHPDAETILIGSSRAQTTPPLWLQTKLRSKTLNLGMGQSDLYSKLMVMNYALQHAPIKNVIWYADYFELLPQMRDKKVKSTPAFSPYLVGDSQESLFEKQSFEILRWREIFDHNMFEAALYSLKVSPPDNKNQGSGSYLDTAKCESEYYPGEKSAAALKRELESTFEHYARKILGFDISQKEWEIFEKALTSAAQSQINVTVLIVPYHPEFLRRLRDELPRSYKAHQDWRVKLNGLNKLGLRGLRIIDFFDGIPKADGSEKFWNDGTHFNCHGAVKLLSSLSNN